MPEQPISTNLRVVGKSETYGLNIPIAPQKKVFEEQYFQTQKIKYQNEQQTGLVTHKQCTNMNHYFSYKS